MPVYRGKTPGTWRVVVYRDGSQREETVRGSKRDALARDAELRLAAPTIAETRAGLTLAQWCEGPYLEALRPRVRASTWTLRRQSLRQMLPHLDGVRLASLTTADLERAVAARCREVQPGTVRRDVQALRAALRASVEAGHRVGRHVLRAPAAPAQQATAYTVEELRELFAAADCEDAELGRMLRWLTLTGLRRGEAIAARWAWLVGDELRIPTVDTLTGWRPKARGRTVPLSGEALALLGRRCEPSRKLWRWTVWPQHLAETAWDAAGLPGGAHRLRHTFASMFLSNCSDLWLLGQVLGHADVSTTGMYLHMLPGQVDRARGAVTLKNLGAGLGKRRR